MMEITPGAEVSTPPQEKTQNLDYNLGWESVRLFLEHEMRVSGVIDQENEKLVRLADQMEDFERFLGLVQQKTDDSERVDFQTAEERELIDRMRERGDLQHIFPHGVYTWKGKQQIEHLTRLAHQHVEGPLQREISLVSQKMVLEENKLIEVLSMFKAGLQRIMDLNRHILSNIQRIH